ncbi:MAG: Mut7-C RNAse domain-containing protein [Acidobacteriota bacterium]
MGIVTFRFYAELNDFLPQARRQKSFHHAFQGKVAVKDMIESLGVPHTEVDLILANGCSVDFSYPVQPGDAISVFPVFEAFDISPLLRVRARPLRVIRFVLDVHLGRLAALLRLLGFDSLYRNDLSDGELAQLSREQSRVLLTRDRGLLKRSEVTHGYCVRSTTPRSQVAEVVRRFDLIAAAQPFSRCLKCNDELEDACLERVRDEVPPGVQVLRQEFKRCPRCGRVFWKGTHYRRLESLIADLRRESGASTQT